jgi:hypothetical protein
MTDKQKQWLVWGILVVMIAVAGFLGIEFPVPVPAPPVAVAPQAFTYPPGAIYFAEGGKSQVFQSGSSATYNSGAQLTASSGSTVTLNGATAMASDKFTVNGTTGQVVMTPISDTDTANYDSLFLIEHDMVGGGTKDRIYGLDVEMTRPAGYATTVGDQDNAGIKVRMVNKAVGNATGNTLRGIDVNVKNDNPDSTITNLSGATFTAQTDTGSPPAGNVSTAYAVQGQITGNGPITDSLIVADFRNFRQTATVPAIEYGVQIRNGNTTGTGIDRGLSFKSEAATVGNFDYIIHMDDAAATVADIKLSNSNVIAATEGKVVYNATHSVTAAEINSGHTLVTVPAGLKFALVDAKATAYGATCTTSTSVYLKAGSVTLVTYTVANLVQNTLLELTTTGVAVVADGASFTTQTAGDDVTAISDAATTAGCTGVKVVLSYTLEE